MSSRGRRFQNWFLLAGGRTWGKAETGQQRRRSWVPSVPIPSPRASVPDGTTGLTDLPSLTPARGVPARSGLPWPAGSLLDTEPDHPSAPNGAYPQEADIRAPAAIGATMPRRRKRPVGIASGWTRPGAAGPFRFGCDCNGTVSRRATVRKELDPGPWADGQPPARDRICGLVYSPSRHLMHCL